MSLRIRTKSNDVAVEDTWTEVDVIYTNVSI